MLHRVAKGSLHQMNLTALCGSCGREGQMVDLLDMEIVVDL